MSTDSVYHPQVFTLRSFLLKQWVKLTMNLTWKMLRWSTFKIIANFVTFTKNKIFLKWPKLQLSQKNVWYIWENWLWHSDSCKFQHISVEKELKFNDYVEYNNYKQRDIIRLSPLIWWRMIICVSHLEKKITVLILKHFMFAKKLNKLKIECECKLQSVVEIVDFRKIVNMFI